MLSSSSDPDREHEIAPSGGPIVSPARSSLLTTEFIADMAHDLRAPLTSINGYVDYLLEGIAGELTEVQREFLERAKASSARLMSVLGDLFDLMRLEAGGLTPTLGRVHLATGLAAVMVEVRPNASHRAIELVAGDATNAVVWADRDMLQRLLLTLLRRAVSRTPDAGRVFVDFNLDESGSVVASVRDMASGPALDARCFETFECLPASVARDTSTGLELAMAKALVDVQGGRIWGESEPGRGSVICFTLPVSKGEVIA
jgi:signal transduction histidine kinase